VLERNPLADLKSLADRRNIQHVMQGGKFVTRQFAGSDNIPEELLAKAWVCCS
jgi:hypothetical protein